MSDATRPIDPSQFDTTVLPEQDFFRYINGGWLDSNPVPPEYGSWGAFHEVNEGNQALIHRLMEDAAGPSDTSTAEDHIRMAGDYYAAAMDESAIAAAGAVPLLPLLDQVTAIESLGHLAEAVVVLQRHGVGALYDMGIAPDFEDADSYLVYMGQGGLGLPERDYYLRDDEHSQKLRDAYVAHVTAQLANLGDDADVAQDAAARIMEFETALAQASYPAEKMRDVQLTMNRHRVDALDDLMPSFHLTSHARALGVTSATVNIDNPGFFSALESLLAGTSFETLRDYLRWHVVRSFASSLSPAFENEAFDFYGKALGGQQKMKPRWKRVIDAATADIGEPVSRLFIAHAFSEDAKHRCERMVDHLLSAMGVSISGADWMTDATKAQALEKLSGFSYKIGFPDSWRDFSALEIGRDSHASNRMRCRVFEYDREFGRLGEPVDKSEWAMSAHQVNAYYHPLLNEIVFPAGILQPPFFYADADDAVNYGAIGAVIGHEITHGFDDRGSHFDANGALREWWTEADRSEFARRAQVLIDQFDEYEVAEDLHVNGRLTLGENIADLGGLSLAYAALREAGGLDGDDIDGLTPTQRFFASWATVWHMNYTPEYERLQVNTDPHSPARFRVNGPLANTPEFANAFSIPEGTPLQRPVDRRAKIW